MPGDRLRFHKEMEQGFDSLSMLCYILIIFREPIQIPNWREARLAWLYELGRGQGLNGCLPSGNSLGTFYPTCSSPSFQWEGRR